MSDIEARAEAAKKFSYAGYELPVDLVQLTGGGPESFAVISDSHISALRKFIGIRSSDVFLEIGCGIGRDAIPLTQILEPNGSYTGVDIIKRSIDWCQQNISARYSNFNFIHYDVRDQLHNAGGTSATSDIRLPLKDKSVDKIILWSVFTHMFAKDIVHYFREFSRVLKPGGLVFATCFIYDDAVLASAQIHNLTPFNLRFEHPFESGCRVNDPVYPAGAVAFTEERLKELVAAGHLELARPILRGNWSGLYADVEGVGQDAVILRRSSLLTRWLQPKTPTPFA